MKNLKQITEPIHAELAQFEAFFTQTLKADTEPMDSIMRYVLETNGKRLRPILVLLSAKLFGEINERTLRAATFVEMVHSATLIHDDVVDGSDLRRGQDSVKAHFGNLSAVLAGDYLLAKALQLLAHPTDSTILNEMLQTTAAMSEGELMQGSVGLSYHGDVGLSYHGDVGLSYHGDVGLSYHGSRHNDKPQARLPQCDSPTSRYLDIITRKTALLMRSCCTAGAMSVGATAEQIQQIADFGINFGILFQLRDDIIDADNPETAAFARQWLPEYLQKTTEALQPFPDSETVDALRQLTAFCAERTI